MAKVIYQTKLSYYEATEDKYSEGEVGSSQLKDMGGYPLIEADTLQELFKKVNKKLYIEDDSFSNICHFSEQDDEEEGTSCFFIDWYEDIDGLVFDWNKDYNKENIELWKKGKLRLWSCRMYIQVYKIVKMPVLKTELESLKIAEE